MLLVTPVPIRSVFLARFAEGLTTSWIGCWLLLGTPLIGYGVGQLWGLFFLLYGGYRAAVVACYRPAWAHC